MIAGYMGDIYFKIGNHPNNIILHKTVFWLFRLNSTDNSLFSFEISLMNIVNKIFL